MAEGYARASGRPGVAIATSGPGATNLVTAIADAWMDSTPLVCITGQVRSELIGTDAFQEIDATGITLPIVKHSWLVQDPDELGPAIKGAFHVATTGRCGPVLVDIAKNVQEAAIDFTYPDEADLAGWRPPTKVHARQIREAAKAIHEAKRPIVYAGGGVVNANASRELFALVEAGHLPVVTTLMGKGCFPDSHPLNYGAPGMHGSKYANWALNKADLIIAVGARFDDRVTGKVSAFAPGAKVIHFDVDAAEVGKIREAEIPVVGPLDLALAELTAALRELSSGNGKQPSEWLRQLDEWRELYPFKYRRNNDALKPQTVLETLRDLTAGRDDMIWTTGVGQHQMWAMQYLQCDQPRSFITSGGLGTMGYGVPAAIGAKGGASRRDRRVRRRRRLLPDDVPGARDRSARAAADRRRDREQRLARDGAPVAGALLRGAVLRDAPHAPGAGLRDARRGVRLRGLHRVERGRPRGDAHRRARRGAHRRRRRALRSRGEVLPDGSRGRRRRRRRARASGRGGARMTHTLSVQLEDKPGALARVSQLFTRRGYNIESLAVGPTERRGVSRLTLRVNCSEHTLEQIEKQMHKLVNVLRVTELSPTSRWNASSR